MITPVRVWRAALDAGERRTVELLDIMADEVGHMSAFWWWWLGSQTPLHGLQNACSRAVHLCRRAGSRCHRGGAACRTRRGHHPDALLDLIQPGS
jgi:hypothetical protein